MSAKSSLEQAEAQARPSAILGSPYVGSLCRSLKRGVAVAQSDVGTPRAMPLQACMDAGLFFVTVERVTARIPWGGNIDYGASKGPPQVAPSLSHTLEQVTQAGESGVAQVRSRNRSWRPLLRFRALSGLTELSPIERGRLRRLRPASNGPRIR